MIDSKPALPLPEPLCAAEIPSFTHFSVVKRLPDIGRRALAENQFSPETAAAIQNLIDEIPDGPIREVDIPLARDAEEWNEYIRPYLGMDWLHIPWFFAEEYFYVRVLEATGYFHPGPGRFVDPYRAQKRLGLESTRAAIRVLAEQITHALYGPPASRGDALTRLLLADLWGNQNDLSMWPVRQDQEGRSLQGGSATHTVHGDGKPGATQDELVSARKHLLADDTPALLDYLDTIQPGKLHVDFLLDNAGYELVADLALADFLLTQGMAERVTLHTKVHPVFVSDALEQDVYDTLDFLTLDVHEATRGMALRLRRSLVSGQLVLTTHPFWTSPLPFWQLPDDLLGALQESHLLISKGDANYRRLLGDRHWPIEMPFEQVVSYLPLGVLALRTLKSEIAVGIDSSSVPEGDPEWMINGRWGLIQFAPPAH